MKITAKNGTQEQVIEVINEPVLFFEEIPVATKNLTDKKTIMGNFRWNLLRSSDDLSAFFEDFFILENNEWVIETCFVCEDKQSIFFRNATRK